MMNEAIEKFASQFSFEPEIINADGWKASTTAIVAGMGGSHLAADLLESYDPSLRLLIHKDYGLPVGFESQDVSLIASSYSGNTEETVSAFEEAVAKKVNVAAIAVGGKLLERARTLGAPYIQLPNTGIQPRSALGLSFRAIAKLLGREDALQESARLTTTLAPMAWKERGQELAQMLKDHVPVVYASARNFSIAYNWKIKFNETGKIPAFYNVFPELNHNEMTGFDVQEGSRPLSDRFFFVFLRDAEDHPQNLKRMDVTKKLYEDRGLPVTVVDVEGTTRLERMFGSLLVADWTAFYTAEQYGLESEQVPMVEEFKKEV
jgi:glucose/mannose-6-phosphate isomerase